MAFKIALSIFIQIAKVCTFAVTKVLGYKNGTLLIVNSGFSTVITLGFYFSKLLEGTNIKNLVLPIVIYLCGFAIYHILSILDLITGLMNAKYQNSILPTPEKTYIKSYRLWFTFWKNIGISIFTLFLMGLCFLAELVKGEAGSDDGVVGYLGAGLYTTFIWILVVGWGAASSFEIKSIGDNILKRVGSKPSFFILFDELINIFWKKITLKAKNSFNSIESDSEEMDNFENPANINPKDNEKNI